MVFFGGWVGLQKLITDLDMSNGYKGGPGVSPLSWSKILTGRKNIKWLLLKKIKKRYFQGRYKGGPLGALSHEAKFKQDAKI
jgi:hypothetical protein